MKIKEIKIKLPTEKESVARFFENCERRKKFISSVLSSNKYIKIEILECGSLTNLERDFRLLISRQDGYNNEIISDDNNEGLLKDLFVQYLYSSKINKIWNN